MANASCYNIEGIQVCPPEDAKKYRDYVLIGVALLTVAFILSATALNGSSAIGTELLNDPTYYLGY